MRAGRIILIIFTGVFVLVAVAFLAVGGFLVWLHASHGDGQGYLNSMPLNLREQRVPRRDQPDPARVGRGGQGPGSRRVRRDQAGSTATPPAVPSSSASVRRVTSWNTCGAPILPKSKRLRVLSPASNSGITPERPSRLHPAPRISAAGRQRGVGNPGSPLGTGAGDFVVVVMNADASSASIARSGREPASPGWSWRPGWSYYCTDRSDWWGAGLLAFFAITGD